MTHRYGLCLRCGVAAYSANDEVCVRCGYSARVLTVGELVIWGALLILAAVVVLAGLVVL